MCAQLGGRGGEEGGGKAVSLGGSQRWRRSGNPCGGYTVNRHTVDGVEQMVELMAGGIGPVSAAGGACAERALADLCHTDGVSRVGGIFKGDGDWFARVHQQIAAGVDDISEVALGHPQPFRNQIHQIALAACAEVECDRAMRNQRCAMVLDGVIPCGPPMNRTCVFIGIGFVHR